MYSTEFFIKQFHNQETATLIDRLATQDLSDAARDALTQVLGDRGLSGEQLAQQLHQAKRDRFLRTGVDNLCDYCRRTALPLPFAIEGQKFCNIDCFHQSRLRRAAVDIDDAQAMARGLALKAGRCPQCSGSRLHPDMHRAHHIASMLVVVTTSTEQALSCTSCANRANLWAALMCACMGWWSVPGLFRTPFHIVENLWEIVRRREVPVPTDALVDMARLQLADEHLRSVDGGRYGLRA
jgi:hypothetical protein